MDLLGVHQDISLIHKPPMQLPETPRLSSSQAVTEKRDNKDDEDEELQQHKRNKRVKSDKTRNKTKMRLPKVSFITKTEVLHLEDGYKWRKYGQKPVKNSPFPRHYYRCTTCWCDVKKRVERSFSDPTTVITTYEGRHTHFRPLIMSKGGNQLGSSPCSASGPCIGLPTLPPQLLFHYNNQQHELPNFGTKYINNQENGHDDEYDGDGDGDHVMTKSRTRDFLDEDNGLLQDVVSSHIIKQEYN